MIVEINRAFSHIYYIDRGHEYLNKETNKKLVSVTGYKKVFQNEFKNADHWLKKKAMQAGVSINEMQDEWTNKRIVGVSRGSIIHDWVEGLTLRKELDLELNMEGMAKLKYQALQYIDDYKFYTNVATELVIGNDLLGGQIDRLAVDEENRLGILDYKTDTKSEDKLLNSYGKKMLGKMKLYDDCILNGYFIQVNAYRQIMEEAGFPIHFMEIVHFNYENETYRVYSVPKIDVIFSEDVPVI